MRTKTKERPYLVGRYLFNDGMKGIAAVRAEDVDCLPPTMREVVRIHAQNKREAVRLFRASLNPA